MDWHLNLRRIIISKPQRIILFIEKSASKKEKFTRQIKGLGDYEPFYSTGSDLS
jgi:hypothetical protein